jgi:hypothetical protein
LPGYPLLHFGNLLGKIICDKLIPLRFQSHNDNLDEDQISSASDSSFSSSHRAALTAGEVKTLARMQEESKLAHSIRIDFTFPKMKIS